MTTYVLYTAMPNAGTGNSGEAAYTDSGLRIDDTITGTGINKAQLDFKVGSTTAIKIGKLVADIQKFYEKKGLSWMASSDGGTTKILPIL